MILILFRSYVTLIFSIPNCSCCDKLNVIMFHYLIKLMFLLYIDKIDNKFALLLKLGIKLEDLFRASRILVFFRRMKQ